MNSTTPTPANSSNNKYSNISTTAPAVISPVQTPKKMTTQMTTQMPSIDMDLINDYPEMDMTFDFSKYMTIKNIIWVLTIIALIIVIFY